MLKRCTFCKHYQIGAVYFPEQYGLPLSTICTKLQYPRMYEQGDLDDIELWGFMKDCDLYERAKSLPQDLEKQCDEWEKLLTNKDA
tara:strand:+ start:646 stop:903 length:258 start_codon:yes stop_codon:yes gene_type:complete